MRLSAAVLSFALITLPLSSQTINDFQSAVEYPNFTSGTPMALSADFNKDGKQDLLTFGQNGQVGQICVALGNGDASFQMPVCSLVPDPYLRAAAVGDFNNDGDMDVVLAGDSGGGNIYIMLGDGTGHFTQAASYSTGGISDQAFTVAVADLNGDHNPDVVATLACSNIAALGCTQAAILVFHGNGNGTFAAPVSYIPPFGNGGVPVVIGDFNGDGHPDIVVGNQYAPGDQSHSSISVLLGQSGGGFACPGGTAAIPSVPLPASCTAALPLYGIWELAKEDFNGDARSDLVLTSNYGGAWLLFGNGDGTFQIASSILTVQTQSTTTLAVADLNNDGHPDLIVGSDPYDLVGDETVSVLLNDGTGNFTASSPYQGGGTNSASVVAGDFNGDGKPDVVLATSHTMVGSDGTFDLWLGNGDGTLWSYPVIPAHSVANEYYPTEVVGDLNHDGIPDLLRIYNTAGNNASVVSISLGTGGGNFSTPYEVSLGLSGGYPYSAAILKDLNNDGNLDLVVSFLAGPDAGGAVSVLLGKGDGTFQNPTIYDTGGVNSSALTAADVTGDNKLDLVVANQCVDQNCYTGSVSVLPGNGDGTFQTAVATPTLSLRGVTTVAAQDLNNDGRADLVVGGNGTDPYSNSFYSTFVTVLFGNADGTLTEQSTTYTGGGTSGSAGIALALGDVNGDGQPDIVATSSCSDPGGIFDCSSGSVGVLIGSGNGNFSLIGAFNVPDANFLSANLADLNGDGKLDLVAATGTGVFVSYGHGDGTFSSGTVFAGLGRFNSPATLAIADVNGDGSMDIVVPGLYGWTYQFANGYSGFGNTGILLNRTVLQLPFPAPPTNLSASAASNSEIDLLWTNNANNATQVDIEQSLDGTNFTQITAVSPSTNTYTVIALNLGTKYFFRIRAQNATGYSAYSNVANATTFSPAVNLSATTLNFGIFQIGGAYPIPQVKLTNSGTGPLTITSIKNTGSNQLDFNDSNNCPTSPSTLGAGSQCTFAVSFTPTQLGARSASISIADNATGSPQSVALSGTAVDFSVSVVPVSNTTKGGKAASYTVSITPLGGNSLTASLSIAGCPANASCTLSKSSFALNGSTASSTTLSVKPGGKTPKGTYTLTINGQVFTVTRSATATLVLQ